MITSSKLPLSSFNLIQIHPSIAFHVSLRVNLNLTFPCNVFSSFWHHSLLFSCRDSFLVHFEIGSKLEFYSIMQQLVRLFFLRNTTRSSFSMFKFAITVHFKILVKNFIATRRSITHSLRCDIFSSWYFLK